MAKKTKAKEWFMLIAPKIFEEKELGKIMVSNPEKLVGRKTSFSAMEIADDMNKYYMKFILRINRIEGKKAFTELSGSECMRDYISRMVVRRVSRIDVINDFKTKDGIKIRVKALAVISKKAKSSIQKKIRARLQVLLKEDVESTSLDDLIGKIISDEMKSRILSELRGIYPIRNFEIRKTEISSTSK